MPDISFSTAHPSRDTFENNPQPRHVTSPALAEAGLTALKQRHAEATARLQKNQEELERLELYAIGYRLMQQAGQAAFNAGQAEGPGLFEQYEAAKETQKVLDDLAAIASIWPLAISPAELQSRIDMLNIQTLTGTIAGVRLVKFYNEVLAHEFREMKVPA